MGDDLDRFCGKPVADLTRDELVEHLTTAHSLMMLAFLVAGQAQRRLERYRPELRRARERSERHG